MEKFSVFVTETKLATEQVLNRFSLAVLQLATLFPGVLTIVQRGGARKAREPRAKPMLLSVLICYLSHLLLFIFEGLGTLAKKMLTQPEKTVEAGKAMNKNLQDLKEGKVKGGNLEAHERANSESTKKSDTETAAAFSALREKYKRIRPQLTKTKDGSFHLDLRDTRTKEETDKTMNANKKGRESALEG